MNEIDTSQLLVQMRAMAAAAQGQPAAAPQQANGPADFSALLKQSIDGVNNLQKASGELGNAFVMGDPNVSLAEVMIAKQKSGIAFQATVQVRNKLLDAYKQIMSMQV
ncbi:MAG TPA: flagellar hook-basal body complex protein FliE [Gammaproteobacteria bacterium]|nr:flagellar hook-basal body complex protein FliE [Gammaproteobacteria bacterium]